MLSVVSSRLKVGMEVHVELATRTKMFTRVANPAHAANEVPEPNTLIDPVVLGLPGALPVLNREAIEMSIRVGMALGCSIAPITKWDRKNYYYPDLPKNYQISQYDLPLCFDGVFEVEIPQPDETERTKRIAIVRAHLEEDAGKLLHEAPGGGAIPHSIADYNRAGTPLLEIVTAPDFEDVEEVVAYAQALRGLCRFLGATEGVMQKGHMRFEPNINCLLTLSDGRAIATPIVEVKNLNSFRSLRGAVEYEWREQPRRFLEDGKVMGPGAKITRGWDDARERTYVQREKEDAHDYRYFPDPDLPLLQIEPAWRERVRDAMPELPASRARRYRASYGMGRKEAAVLVEERETCLFFEAIVADAAKRLLAAPDGATRSRSSIEATAGRMAANLVLQSGFKRANERGVRVDQLGISPAQSAGIIEMREAGDISANAADELFGVLGASDETARAAAERLNLIQVRDEGMMEAWCAETIEANPKVADDVRSGKMQAVGRLVGEVMKKSGGKAEASRIRAMLLKRLGG